MMSLPTLEHEIELWNKGYVVIGMDEVGRGAFAGPLFVGGVIFKPTTDKKRIAKLLSYGINDSKKLKPNLRKMLAKVIQTESLAYYISQIDVPQINRIGIGKSTHAAMRLVVKNLREICKSSKQEKYFALIDGFSVKQLNGIGKSNQQGIVRGDSISLSIAAASIIAKVARDNHMVRLAAKYKPYNWGKNKGYGTAFHRKALAKHGPTPLHRLDFIENYLAT